MAELRRSKALSLLAAYGVVLLAVVVGIVLRFAASMWLMPAPAYHCYDWDGRVARATLAYLLLAPLVMVVARPERAWLTVLALGTVGAVLASFVWSYTVVVPCSPM